MKKLTILLFFFLFISLFLNILSSNYISNNHPSPPTCPDLILDAIDESYPLAMKIAEILIGILILFFLYNSYKNPQYFNRNIFVISSFYLIRALLMPLTLFSPQASSSFFQATETFSYGLFPSGHFALPFLFFLFTFKRDKIWIFNLIMAILVAFLLLLSKQHYSIDIVGSIFICYSIFIFTKLNIFKND